MFKLYRYYKKLNYKLFFFLKHSNLKILSSLIINAIMIFEYQFNIFKIIISVDL